MHQQGGLKHRRVGSDCCSQLSTLQQQRGGRVVTSGWTQPVVLGQTCTPPSNHTPVLLALCLYLCVSLCVCAGLACPTCRWEPAPCRSAAASHAPSPSWQPAGLWCALRSEAGSTTAHVLGASKVVHRCSQDRYRTSYVATPLHHTGSATATRRLEGSSLRDLPSGPLALPTHSSRAETGALSSLTHAPAAVVACLSCRRRSGTCRTTGTWWARWVVTSRTTSRHHCQLDPSAASWTVQKVGRDGRGRRMVVGLRPWQQSPFNSSGQRDHLLISEGDMSCVRGCVA